MCDFPITKPLFIYFVRVIWEVFVKRNQMLPIEILFGVILRCSLMEIRRMGDFNPHFHQANSHEHVVRIIGIRAIAHPWLRKEPQHAPAKNCSTSSSDVIVSYGFSNLVSISFPENNRLGGIVTRQNFLESAYAANQVFVFILELR